MHPAVLPDADMGTATRMRSVERADARLERPHHRVKQGAVHLAGDVGAGKRERPRRVKGDVGRAGEFAVFADGELAWSGHDVPSWGTGVVIQRVTSRAQALHRSCVLPPPPVRAWAPTGTGT